MNGVRYCAWGFVCYRWLKAESDEPRGICTKLTVTNCRLSQRSVAAAGKRECKVAEDRVRRVTISRPPSHCSRTCVRSRVRVRVCVCARAFVSVHARSLSVAAARLSPPQTHIPSAIVAVAAKAVIVAATNAALVGRHALQVVDWSFTRAGAGAPPLHHEGV